MNKKISVFLIVFLLVLSVYEECAVALASSGDVWEIQTTTTLLNETEIIRDTTVSLPADNSVYMTYAAQGDNYTEKLLSCTHNYYLDGILAYSIDEVCTVRYYSDGKVHLSSRTLTGVSHGNLVTGTITYGRIVNTDGSISYTSGDMATLTAYDGETKHFTLEFYVKISGYSFHSSMID